MYRSYTSAVASPAVPSPEAPPLTILTVFKKHGYPGASFTDHRDLANPALSRCAPRGRGRLLRSQTRSVARRERPASSGQDSALYMSPNMG